MDVIPFLFSGLLLGCIAGYSLCEMNEIDPLINECQADLPRSQKCVLIAVPEGE